MHCNLFRRCAPESSNRSNRRKKPNLNLRRRPFRFPSSHHDTRRGPGHQKNNSFRPPPTMASPAAFSRTAMRTLRASARTSSSAPTRAFSAELADEFRPNITSDRLIPSQVGGSEWSVVITSTLIGLGCRLGRDDWLANTKGREMLRCYLECQDRPIHHAPQRLLTATTTNLCHYHLRLPASCRLASAISSTGEKIIGATRSTNTADTP